MDISLGLFFLQVHLFLFVCGQFVLVLSLAFSVAGFRAKCGEVVVGWLVGCLTNCEGDWDVNSAWCRGSMPHVHGMGSANL
jgi:hypothetical protein